MYYLWTRSIFFRVFFAALSLSACSVCCVVRVLAL